MYYNGQFLIAIFHLKKTLTLDDLFLKEIPSEPLNLRSIDIDMYVN